MLYLSPLAMTLPQSETPLRRSAVGSYPQRRSNITVVNDDEAERQEARRRTLIQQQQQPAESIEENETIRKCLEIYNGNKLSRDNAWSLSLIDTLSSLLERHHKTLSNFKMAGSSLEASSKVYGLRVDSIYLDTIRMSAGLNARKLTEQQLNAADNDDSLNADANTADPHAGGGDAQEAAAPKPKKRARKAVATVTKNKDTLNARLDTVPLQDPVFGKLNSTVGSINASNRLMSNILPTFNSELRLRANYLFWDDTELPPEITDFTEVKPADNYMPEELVNGEWVEKLLSYNQRLVLRPMHTGYKITEALLPRPTDDQKESNETLTSKNKATDAADEIDDDGVDHNDMDFYDNPKELSVAFDMNAECEPMPDMDARPIMLEVDPHDLEELTTEEHATLQYCRALRKKPVVFEDLRPVDGKSTLEYSYRPMDKIAQFWAGPSHWKFTHHRGRSTLTKSNIQGSGATATGNNQRGHRALNAEARRRNQELTFGVFHDDLFVPIDQYAKQRKVNFRRSWDARKLMLPTRYSFEPNFFFRYEFAPSIRVSQRFGEPDAPIDEDDSSDVGADPPDDVELFDREHFSPDTPATPTLGMNVSTFPFASADGMDMPGDPANTSNMPMRASGNDTVLEISTEMEGAPKMVTKVVVPFAKRAKVVDMKDFKKCGVLILQNKMVNEVPDEAQYKHPKYPMEKYAKGIVSYSDVLKGLPKLLKPQNVDVLSPSVALYAILHLANDMNLRLIPQDDLRDFKIRRVLD